MNGRLTTLALTGAGAAAALAGRAVARRRAAHGTRSDHWLAVTVARPLEDVEGARALPEPLERLSGQVDLRFRAAPGDRGTEVLGRPRGDAVSREDLRVALRKAKSLLETGTVVQPDARPSTHPGPAGKVLQFVVRKSKGEGRL
ncbi:hypothetical protein ACFFSW_28690 [Saccharothrix longispora]|uniref:PASTA domain-containing protein n=1 Tax=Saccharothrix longispora TaxID=33920 RepID=A0ABU1PRM3_9PSEU|nr:hypothetical protein [Saccharothrix longispora]MDR6593290.1 hypothetical protein [Saccharothrix longispora]